MRSRIAVTAMISLFITPAVACAQLTLDDAFKKVDKLIIQGTPPQEERREEAPPGDRQSGRDYTSKPRTPSGDGEEPSGRDYTSAPGKKGRDGRRAK